jgi:multicomponent Na+:H+ antiporter subunit C
MALLTAITVGIVMAVSIYLLLSRELKAVAMGVFLLGHAANIGIIAVSRSPLGKRAPVLGEGGQILGNEVDPLPQALILTAIVIGFALQAFLLTLLVITWRRGRSLELADLAALAAPVERRRGSHDPGMHRFDPDEDPLLDPQDDDYYAATHTLDTRN